MEVTKKFKSYIFKGLKALFLIYLSWAALQGAGLVNSSNPHLEIGEIPACDSDELRDNFTRIIQRETSLEIIGKVRSFDSGELGGEKQLNPQTGVVASLCGVLAKTNKGRGAFMVTVFQEPDDREVYYEIVEADAIRMMSWQSRAH